MVQRVRPSPREKILSLFTYEKSLTRLEVAEKLGITYWSARYWLDKLASEGLLVRKPILIGRAVRRVLYYLVLPKIYFRTQYAILFYREAPRTKTPDPIAEMRVTAVSDRRDAYNLDAFKDACVHIGIILSPQTYWVKQNMEITADEKDEPIDMDELFYSVPVYKLLNYAERYAIFFRSKRDDDKKWRVRFPYWWTDSTAPRPLPEEEDFEYDEKYIKELEEKKVALGVLKMKFNNVKGVLESV